MSDPQQYVTVGSAAAVTGISERTIRYWVSSGKLAATAGKRGRLVALGDVQRLADLTGRDPAATATAVGSADSKPGNVAVEPSVSAREQLEAIRDEWLAPLVAQISDQAETIGRLGAELDHERQRTATAESERDALQARVAELEARNVESPARDAEVPPAATQRTWWQVWRPRS